MTASSTCAGTLARDERMLRTGSVSIRALIACAVPPACGDSAVSIS